MIIFDHINIILNMYKYLLLYFKSVEYFGNKSLIDKLIYNYMDIFHYLDDTFENFRINNGYKNINLLMLKYNRIVHRYLKIIQLDPLHLLHPFLTTLKILLDGLLLVALLLLHFDKTEKDEKIINNFNYLMLNIDQKNTFIKYLMNVYEDYESDFKKNNHFFNYIFSGNTQGINFGLNHYSQGVRGGKKNKKTKKGGVTSVDIPSHSDGIISSIDSEIKSLSEDDEIKSLLENDEIKFNEVDLIDDKIIESVDSKELKDCYADTYTEKENFKKELDKIINELKSSENVLKGFNYVKEDANEEQLKKLLTENDEKKDLLSIQEDYNDKQFDKIIAGGNKKIINRKIRRLKKYN
jgi:hypothetical protein